MENKYYTPEISEFYSGFEYELLGHSGKMVPGGITQKWEKLEYSLDASYLNDEDSLKELLDCEEIRVKYLDQSDIEELGFIPDPSGERYFEKEEYQLYLNIHPIHNITIYTSEYGDIKIIFQGTIKNKSELKKVLNMLNIK